MEEFTPNVSKDSKYNEWSFKMIRLANLQLLANNSQMKKDYPVWYDSLSCIYKEIAGKLSDVERNYCELQLERISKKIINSIVMGNDKVKHYQRDRKEIKIRNIDSELFDFDTYLRVLMDKHKFGAPDREEEMF